MNKEWMLQQLRLIQQTAFTMKLQRVMRDEVDLIHAYSLEMANLLQKELEAERAEASQMLQGVDQEMEAQRASGCSVLEAQLLALVKAQASYEPLSMPWRWYMPRIAGAFHELASAEKQAALARRADVNRIVTEDGQDLFSYLKKELKTKADAQRQQASEPAKEEG